MRKPCLGGFSAGNESQNAPDAGPICAAGAKDAVKNPVAPAEKVRIFDLHCDTLDRLALHACHPEAGFMAQDAAFPAELMNSLEHNACYIALDRMRAAAYEWCQCFACFVPDGLTPDEAWAVFKTVRTYFERQAVECAPRIAQARYGAEVLSIIESGACAALFTIEGGSFLDPEAPEPFDRLREAAAAGVKMMTLTWNGPNAIASGNKTLEGLSLFGHDVLAEMAALDMVVDVSHLNDKSFWDVCRAVQVPFAASHSNARAVCGHPRNLTDDQFRALAERGGVAGLNFCEAFLIEAGHAAQDDVLRHVDHFLELGGEHVLALGSDYDGCDVPDFLHPAENIGAMHGLLKREFGATVAEDICFNNAHDFFCRFGKRQAVGGGGSEGVGSGLSAAHGYEMPVLIVEDLP